MRRRLAAINVLLLVAVAAPPLPAQENTLPAATQQELQQLFASPTYAAQRFGPARWIENGAAYTTVESDSTGSSIVRYETATGARTVLVAAAQLTPPGTREGLEIADYAWSSDARRLLVFTNTARVWRDETRGDYWVLDLASGALRQLAKGAPPATLMFAKCSPDGTRGAYVQQGDLYVENVADGARVRLTSNGSKTLVNGTTDWVYEEEFNLRDAFRWSPDGTRIAYWQFDMTGVRDFLLINDTDSLYSFTIPVQYPKAGTTNSAVKAGVVNATGGETVWLQLPGDPRDDYLPRMEWAGPSELLLQRMNRIQNTNRVMLADAGTGAVRDVFVERDSAWLDVVEEITWLDDGKRFLWPSERDGWQHIYSVSRDGREVKLLTPGEYDVIRVLRVDPKGSWIYFDASPENAAQHYLYRVPLKGGAAQRVTPAADVGSNSYDISPDARWALHTVSRMDAPPRTALVRLPGHQPVRTLVANAPLRAAAASLLEPPTEFFRIDIGNGVALDGWLMKPRDFDPSKRYPLLMYVYTEPASQTVVDRWGGARMLWHRFLAGQGYIVASVDNRGTPGPRGRAWRKVVYQQIGTLASRDQADAVRALVRTRPYIDASRVGVWGWSGGGTATLNALFRYPDVYHVGMSVAPVPDEHLYDTVYQERYMGLPQQHPEVYQQSSAISHAAGLEGDLLVVHGTGDDNVHYQGTERLINRLVELGKPFDVMVYPNRTHAISEGRGTTLHLYSLLTRYLLDHLPAGARGAGGGNRSGPGGQPAPPGPLAYENSSRTIHTAMIIAAMSAVRPAATACRVFLMPMAPK
ncbi:MAG: S9 family peptidase [Gemmatimonadetes bacterium]|nr:S9 family peptidase [Gemmatimonadota bacterium]